MLPGLADPGAGRAKRCTEVCFPPSLPSACTCAIPLSAAGQHAFLNRILHAFLNRSLCHRGTSLMRDIPPPRTPTVGLYPGSYGGSGGGAVSYQRGTPASPSQPQSSTPFLIAFCKRGNRSGLCQTPRAKNEGDTDSRAGRAKRCTDACLPPSLAFPSAHTCATGVPRS